MEVLMKTLTIAVAQLKSSPNMVEHTTDVVRNCMEEAKKKQADICVFPECFLTGYHFPITNEDAITLEDTCIQRIQQKAKECAIGVLITSFVKGEQRPRNTAILIDRNGTILLRYDKVHTCDFADEAMIEAGDHFEVCTFDDIQIGVMICYDREYPESARELMLQGAEIILVPNDCGCMKPRLGVLQTRAYENMCGIVMANAPGSNAGNSCAYSPIPWDENEHSIDMELMMADAISERLYYVTYDVDALRRYRSSEMMGNTFRKCHAYPHLVEDTVQEPFIRRKKTS